MEQASKAAELPTGGSFSVAPAEPEPVKAETEPPAPEPEPVKAAKAPKPEVTFSSVTTPAPSKRQEDLYNKGLPPPPCKLLASIRGW